MKRLLLSLCLCATMLIATSCATTPIAKKERGKTTTLIEYLKVGSINVNDAKKAMTNIGINDSVIETMNLDVAIYHITYHSTLGGDSVILSGFVSLPDDATLTDTLRHIQYNHAMLTPFKNTLGMGAKDAPSLYSGKRSAKDSTKKSLEARLFGLGLASNGFFVSMPDYMGYGQTKGEDHPLLNTAELQIQATDMAIAARELARVMEYTLEDGIYLTGWSEGGAVALAQQRYMEASHTEIPVMATKTLAGVYNPSKWAQKLTTSSKTSAAMLSWMLYSHLMNGGDTTLIKPSTIWKKPIKRQSDAVGNMFDKSAKEIFTPQFLNAGHATIAKLLAPSDNHTGWTPRAPITLHHGDKDNLVELSQSTDALAGLKKSGASDIQIITHQGADHWTPLPDYFLSIVKTFKK